LHPALLKQGPACPSFGHPKGDWKAFLAGFLEVGEWVFLFIIILELLYE
jgi:hypothetical protein